MKEVFIVEDDNDIRELIEYLLVDTYKVQSFPNAEDFSQTLISQHPDLILLDIMLPDGNGADICSKIKKQKDTAQIPVILMSAHMDHKILANSSANDFISKPFDIDDLTARIRLQLE